MSETVYVGDKLVIDYKHTTVGHQNPKNVDGPFGQSRMESLDRQLQMLIERKSAYPYFIFVALVNFD